MRSSFPTLAGTGGQPTSESSGDRSIRTALPYLMVILAAQIALAMLLLASAA